MDAQKKEEASLTAEREGREAAGRTQAAEAERTASIGRESAKRLLDMENEMRRREDTAGGPISVEDLETMSAKDKSLRANIEVELARVHHHQSVLS
jgi:hypothetical protein